MMCENLWLGAKNKDIDCPIRVTPKCHPRAHCEVFVDLKKYAIILTCSRCDRPISTVRVKRRAR